MEPAPKRVLKSDPQAQKYGRQLAICFVLTIAILGVLVLLTLAFGGDVGTVPSFPFQNSRQFGVSIPGWDFTEAGAFPCRDGSQGMQVVYTAVGGGPVWGLYIGETGRLVGAYFPSQSQTPQYLVTGTIDTETGRLTLGAVRPFDAESDRSPCQFLMSPAGA